MIDRDFEIEQLRAKVKRLEHELAQAEADAERFDQERRRAERALSEVYSQLESQSAADALDLINSVMQAPLADDKDAEANRNQVAKIRSLILDEYLPISGPDCDRCRCEAVTEEWCNLQLKPWLKGKKTIALIGEFSAGKTSIINRLLSYDCPDSPQLPVSGESTTAIATYISYGPEYEVAFADANGHLREMSPETFEKVNKDVLNRVNISSFIRYFVIRYPNPLLRGLCLIDTPGFSSNDAEDAFRASDAVREADALFWVIDVNTGALNESSLQVLREIGDIPIYIIINRIDEKSAEEVDKVEAQIRQVVVDYALNVSGFIKFSAKDSSLDSILRVISNLPDRHKGIEIAQVLAELKRELDVCGAQVERLSSEIRSLEAERKRKMDSVNDKLEIISDLAEALNKMPRQSWAPFAGAFYKIDTDDFVRYAKRCEAVELTSMGAKAQFEEFVQGHQQSLEKRVEYDKCKARLNNLSNISNRLKDTFRGYDLTYYNVIYNAAKQMIKSN